jgi:hypothetical protein
MTEPATGVDEPGEIVWLWDRNRTLEELELVAVPADRVPAEWIAPLQRRYAAGDRVLFRLSVDDERGMRPGTVVQDQGVYLAISGDTRGDDATAHKVLVEPLTREPEIPAAPAEPDRPAASPDIDPELRTSPRCLTARWKLGEPVAPGTRWLATLTVDYTHDGYFRAVLRTVLEQHSNHSVSESWAHSAPAAVLSQTAARYSAQRLREVYQEALHALRHHFHAGDTTVTGLFTPPRSWPQHDR